jgi:hypothetical protein
MSDHTVTRDQLRRFVGVSDPTPISVPTRRWTDKEWAIISREREIYDMDNEWIAFAETDRLFLHRNGRSIFEARFAHGDDGWALTELFVCGNPDIYPRQRDAFESAHAEFLIESVALGILDGPARQKMEKLSPIRLKPRSEVEARLRGLRSRPSGPQDDSGLPDDPPDTPGPATLATAGPASQTLTAGAFTPSHSRAAGTAPGACLLCRYVIPAIKTSIGTIDVPVGLCQKCSSLSCGSHGERTGAPAFLCILCDTNLQASSAGWATFVAGGGLAKLPGGRGAGGGPAGSPPGDRGGPPARTGAEAADLAYALASLFSEADGNPSPLVVQNLEEWTAARPSYQQLTDALTESVDDAVEEIDAILGFGPDTNQPEANRADATGEPSGTAQAVPGGYEIGDVRSLWASLNNDRDGTRLLASAVLLSVILDLPVNRMPAPVAAVATILGGGLRHRFSNEIPAIHQRVVAEQYYRPQV